MFAKRLFYACAGLLCLAVAYQVGVQRASAQTGSTFVVGSFDPDTDPLVIDASGQMWMMGHANSPGVRVGPVSLPKPGTVLEATASVVGGSFATYVLYADGDAYHYDRTSWHFDGNVVGGPTPSRRESWGSVKARFRAAPSAPSTTSR